MNQTNIRPPAAAGRFYPADEEELKNLLSSFWPASTRHNPRIKAILSPHAGYIYSGPTAAKAYALLEPSHYSNIILLGPSHFFGVAGLAGDNHDFWQTPLGVVRLKKLPLELPFSFSEREFHLPEHSLEVQLPFLQYSLKQEFTISPFLTSIPKYLEEVTNFINQNLDEKTLLVVSSDLSHYYPQELAVSKDRFTIETILNLDLETALRSPDSEYPAIEACGQWAIAILIKLARENNWQPQLVDYTTSAQTSGDYNSVVGYASIIFTD